MPTDLTFVATGGLEKGTLKGAGISKTYIDANELDPATYCFTLCLLAATCDELEAINCGITEALSAISPDDTRRYLSAAGAAQKLLSPAEMGELFKVIAFHRGDFWDALGFREGDRTHTL